MNIKRSLVLIGSTLVLAIAFACSRKPAIWGRFDDPKKQINIADFVKSIEELSNSERSEALEHLHASLKSDHLEIRRRSAITLGKLGDMSGVEIMIADFSRTTSYDRGKVAVALRILGDRRAIPVFREALKDKSVSVRSIALASLGEMKAVEAYAEIVAHTKDKEQQDGTDVRAWPAEEACYALGVLGDMRAVPVLIGLLSDRDLQSPAQQALELLTKKNLGNDPGKWESWWKQQRTK
jgi:HEAT repeat protein